MFKVGAREAFGAVLSIFAIGLGIWVLAVGPGFAWVAVAVLGYTGVHLLYPNSSKEIQSSEPVLGESDARYSIIGRVGTILLWVFGFFIGGLLLYTYFIGVREWTIPAVYVLVALALAAFALRIFARLRKAAIASKYKK